jgi:hypothetical protein
MAQAVPAGFERSTPLGSNEIEAVMRMGVAVIATFLALLAATVLVAVWVWQQLGDTVIGLHGIIALVLGISFTVLLAAGLMVLVFFSHRHGYDDEVGH